MNARDQRLFRLQECPGIGPAALTRVLAGHGPPDNAFFGRAAAWYHGEFHLPRRACEALSQTGPAVATDVGSLPVCALTHADSGFPARLRSWPGSPPLLWTLEAYKTQLPNGNITVLASSGAETAHTEMCKQAIHAAIESGAGLVAGHNRPIYQWALLAAKRCGTPSVMVLDRGLLEAFDGDLQRDPIAPARIWGYGFDAERCTVLSPFRLRDGWIGENSRIRDALVVALSDIIVAIGIRPGGTMQRLCREALARSRTVFACADSLPLLEDAGARPWTGRLDG